MARKSRYKIPIKSPRFEVCALENAPLLKAGKQSKARFSALSFLTRSARVNRGQMILTLRGKCSAFTRRIS
jgi:hypothetical protein